jgi:hypothetical protein
LKKERLNFVTSFFFGVENMYCEGNVLIWNKEQKNVLFSEISTGLTLSDLLQEREFPTVQDFKQGLQLLEEKSKYG